MARQDARTLRMVSVLAVKQAVSVSHSSCRSVSWATRGQLIKSVRLPDRKYAVSSVVAGEGLLVATGRKSPTVYIVSK